MVVVAREERLDRRKVDASELPIHTTSRTAAGAVLWQGQKAALCACNGSASTVGSMSTSQLDFGWFGRTVLGPKHSLFTNRFLCSPLQTVEFHPFSLL